MPALAHGAHPGQPSAMSQTKGTPVAAPRKRTRLSPEARQDQILDAAAELIADDRLTTLNMEGVAHHAGVSKSLIYGYFPTLTDLLTRVLEREHRRLRALQVDAGKGAESLEQLVRRVTNAYMTYMEERGPLIERLSADPRLALQGDPTHYHRQVSVDYLAGVLVESLGIDLATATAAVDISFGLPAAAGHYLIRHDADRQNIEDITVTMILGSVEAVGARFGAAPAKRATKRTRKRA